MNIYGSGIYVTQCEELDQYAGEAELRKVTQSTMRGGELFWDFRTFNPPISMNNWANEYAETAETREDTIVVRNTYLDVPVNWLGNQFIEEAEYLKQLNEKAYQHEYLGIPVGVGGNVFQNVEHLDMEQPIDIGLDEPIPLYETFDTAYCGIDWGFATDDFRFVKCHYDSTRLDLYIHTEYSTIETRNETVFNILYKELHLASYDDLIIADSAEWFGT